MHEWCAARLLRTEDNHGPKGQILLTDASPSGRVKGAAWNTTPTSYRSVVSYMVTTHFRKGLAPARTCGNERVHTREAHD